MGRIGITVCDMVVDGRDACHTGQDGGKHVGVDQIGAQRAEEEEEHQDSEGGPEVSYHRSLDWRSGGRV